MDETDSGTKPGFMEGLADGLMKKYMPQNAICWICRKPIVGGVIDFLDKNRNPQKVCISCTLKAIDYYVYIRTERMEKGANK